VLAAVLEMCGKSSSAAVCSAMMWKVSHNSQARYRTAVLVMCVSARVGRIQAMLAPRIQVATMEAKDNLRCSAACVRIGGGYWSGCLVCAERSLRLVLTKMVTEQCVSSPLLLVTG
jgi:hypothetical protein